MDFRELQESDITFMREHSLNKCFYKECPEQTDYTYALEHYNQVLGIGGIRMINNSTAWGWFDLSDAAEDHLIVTYRTVKEWLEILCNEKKIIRLEAYVRVGFEAGVRTVEHLGFKFESRMPQFIYHNPADLFVRFFDGETE